MPAQPQQASAETNLDIDRGAHTIRLTRVFDAPRAEIFQAWTRPEHVSCWWDAAGGPPTTCEIDLRPGRAFRLVREGHPGLPFTGAYRHSAPAARLRFVAVGGVGGDRRGPGERKGEEQNRGGGGEGGLQKISTGRKARDQGELDPGREPGRRLGQGKAGGGDVGGRTADVRQLETRRHDE